MLFFFLAVLAGILTVLAPCILPFLPIIIGASENDGRRISKRALVVINSLSLSVIFFTLLLKASTLLIDIPQSFWAIFSGLTIIGVGLSLLFPELWAKIPLVQKVGNLGNQAIGLGYKKRNYTGDMLIGLALGPVFSSCSPTYFYIIATILPAGFALGVLYLLGFTAGLALSLLLIAYFGNSLTTKITARGHKNDTLKKIFASLIILVGLAILTGYDKKIETTILDSGYGATIELENQLIEKFTPKIMQDEKQKQQTKLETIILAGGCFWCTEAYFQETPGVISAISGYTGGDKENADYIKVSKGNTGHREAVQITYDPQIISTEKILDIYWSHIDPTDKTGQFADKGFQYTTAIYYQTEEQKEIALDSKKRLEKSGVFTALITTEILPSSTFFEAEEYHQDYYKKAADHYERYKKASGRTDFIEENWAKEAAIKFLEEKQAYSYTDEEIAEKLKDLDPLAYHVVAEGGTESPFNNKYWDNKADGIYVDIVTKKPLFSSTHKYDSGTGWPSFWRTIDDDSVTLHEDNSLSTTRTEVRSEGGHVGHVFDDGPVQEGGRRFCTNSASLLFIPKEEMESQGYGDYLYLFEE